MKVLHVLYTSQLSGAENVVADICMMFEGEIETAYCSPDGTIRSALDDRNVRFLPMKKFTYLELKRVIRTFDPDLIHAHDVRATVLASLAAGDIPLISHLHVNKDDMARATVKSILYKWAVEKAEKVIMVSTSCLDEYRYKAAIKEKAVLLENVLNPDRVEKLANYDKKDYGFDFVFIGRLTDQKDPERIARVASKVLQKVPGSRFGIIGEGPLKKDMERIFEQEQVSDQVTFTGRLSYPYRALKDSSCLLMCSKYEGTPIAALEAMALSVPIVSTPADGMKQLVVPHETGFLSTNDEELAESVVHLLTSLDLQEDMSKASYRYYQRLNDHEAYKKKLADLYKTVLQPVSIPEKVEVES
ncbi:glycosyltransferase [Atopococcus tabaci]|uniref:glycosyltransferase n=1 Tax=Atopococcus tabaci TaxID=269774 RepID=UPI0003F8872D|nr:glycosyltransferase [Atopococcus tabaci]